MEPPFSPEKAARLTLVGIVHRHPGVLDHLRDLLEELHPDEITLEMSPFALSWRLCEGPRLLHRLDRILDGLSSREGTDRVLNTHPLVNGIRDLIDIPAEFRAAAGYAGPRDIPLALIDLSIVSARKLRRVEGELVTCRNLQTLLSLPDEGPAGEGYGLARHLVHRDPGPEVRRAFLAGRRGREGIGIRDARMAQKIAQRLRDRPGIHLVHIGGWVHLVEDEDGETLFSRLRDHRPERILLE